MSHLMPREVTIWSRFVFPTCQCHPWGTVRMLRVSIRALSRRSLLKIEWGAHLLLLPRLDRGRGRQIRLILAVRLKWVVDHKPNCDPHPFPAI